MNSKTTTLLSSLALPFFFFAGAGIGGVSAQKIMIHDIQEAQHKFHETELAKEASPFLSSTLKTEVSPVFGSINSVQLNQLSTALVNFLQHVFHDQQVYDVEIVGVSIFEERLIAMNGEGESEGNGKRRRLKLNSLQEKQFHIYQGGDNGYTDDDGYGDDDANADDEDDDNNEDVEKITWEDDKTDEDENALDAIDEEPEKTKPPSFTLTFATVVSAEHTAHQSLSHADFQAMLIHICHKFRNHLVEFVKDIDDDYEYFENVTSVAVNGYEVIDSMQGNYEVAEVGNLESEDDEEGSGSKLGAGWIVGMVVGMVVLPLALFAVKFYRRKQRLDKNKWRTQEIATNNASSSVRSLSILQKSRPYDDDYSFDPLGTENGYNGKTSFDNYGNVAVHAFYRDDVNVNDNGSSSAAVIEDDEIPNPVKESKIPQSSKSNNRQTIFAPPGKVGVAIDVIDGRPVVHKIKKGSPLEGLLKPMDAVVAIDDVDTTSMTAADVTQLMVKRMNYGRKITFVRSEEELLTC